MGKRVGNSSSTTHVLYMLCCATPLEYSHMSKRTGSSFLLRHATSLEYSELVRAKGQGTL